MSSDDAARIVRDGAGAGCAHTEWFHVDWAVLSDVGLARESNEDAAFVGQRLYAVADGMGGHDCGEVASAAATAALSGIEPADLVKTRSALIAAFADAQDRIESIRSESGRLAGTTVTGVCLVEHDGRPFWLAFNIGDSRTYRWAGAMLEQVSVDHSQVQELVDAGYLTADQARVDPRRNVITRALGAGMLPDPDFFAFPAVAGETVLVCSDGLTGELPDSEISEILSETTNLEVTAQSLVEAALSVGGHDNVTIVLARPGVTSESGGGSAGATDPQP